MAKVNIVQTNFTAGELSPSMYGRYDYARYSNGVKELKNCIPLIQGGALKRAGTKLVANSYPLGANNIFRLIPFVYDSNTSYVIEMSEGKLYFYKNKEPLLSSGSRYFINAVFSESLLPKLKYIQVGNSLILVTGSSYPYILKRIADTDWTLEPFVFTVPPLIEGELKTVFGSDTLAYAANQLTLGGARIWLHADVGRQVQFDDGSLVTITNIVSASVVDVVSVVTPNVGTYGAGTWRLTDSPQHALSIAFSTSKVTTATSTNDVFRVGDIGRYIITPSAAYKITGWTDARNVTVSIIETTLTTTDTPVAGTWTLESEVFSTDYGYPSAVGYFEGRLIFGGLTNLPSTIWASKSGEQRNFRLGTADNSAFTFDVATGKNDQIVSIDSDKSLLIFTYSSIISLNGGNEDPLSPKNVRRRVQLTRGINSLAPISISNGLLCVQRNNKKILSVQYDAGSYGYVDSDLTVIADHLLKDVTIVDMAYSQEPYSLIWFVTSAGDLISCTLYQQEQIIAFAKHETEGTIKNVCTIPHNGFDETWLIVSRDGVDYTEVMDYNYNLDKTVYIDNGTPTTTFTDTRLANKTVYVIADGMALGEFTASALGVITLDSPFTTIEAGLAFYPTVSLMPVQFSTPNATSGYNQNTSRVALQFLDTQTATVNGDYLEFFEFGESLLDEPLPLFTGTKNLEQYSIEQDGKQITISQSEPLAFHLLSAMRVIDVNN